MKLYAHRGMHAADVEENSREAFLGVLASVADGVETDVRITKDGVCVIHHDVSNELGELISEITLAQAHGSKPELLRLDEALEILDGYEGRVNIDIKHVLGERGYRHGKACVEETIRIASGRNLDIILSSFSLGNLKLCRELAPQIQRGFLVPFYMPTFLAPFFARRYKCKALHLSKRQARTLSGLFAIRSAHKHSIEVAVYTVNSQKDYERCSRRNVNWIFADEVVALDALKKEERQ